MIKSSRRLFTQYTALIIRTVIEHRMDLVLVTWFFSWISLGNSVYSPLLPVCSSNALPLSLREEESGTAAECSARGSCYTHTTCTGCQHCFKVNPLLHNGVIPLSPANASQSSLLDVFLPALALDGVLDTKARIHSTLAACTHTDVFGSNPWWAVDMGIKYKVHQVCLLNRGDAFGESLHDFRVQLSNSGPEPPSDAAMCQHYTGTAPSRAWTCVQCSSQAKQTPYQWLSVFISGTAVLTLCEVIAYRVPESVVKSTFLTDNNAAILNDNRNDTCITIPPLSQQPGIMNMRLQHLYGAPGTHQVKLHVLNWQCQPNIMFVPDKVTYREQDNFTGLFNRCAFRWQVANTDGISTCLYQCPCSFADCRFIFLRTFEVVEINDAWQLCEIEH